MVQYVRFKKVISFLIILICFFSHNAVAQNAVQDSSSFDVGNPVGVSPQSYKVLGIKVTGLTTTRPQFIISQLGFQKGSTINIPGDDISSAIKRLYKTGLFSDVQINRLSSTPKGIYLEVHVQEQPRLQAYKIRGVKKSQRNDLRDKINLLPGFAVTKASEAQAVNVIKRFYKQKGYWFTKVSVSTGKQDTVRNRETVYFNIKAGEKLEIKNINFDGNKKFTDKVLRKSLGKIKEDKWWRFFSKQVYKQEDYETAKDNLRSFYGAHGYIDFRILKDTVSTFSYDQKRLYVFNTPATGLKVHMKVSEGPQYKVRDISWSGNTVYSNKQLTSILDFKKGDVFNQKKFNDKFQFTQSGNDINSLYQNAGYLFANIDPKITVVGKDSVDINVNIYEDEIATIQKVSFTGNTTTSDDVVRRTIRTLPGTTYNQSKVIRTIRELGTLGYFRKQAIKPNLDPDVKNKTVDIDYSLEESQSTDNFQFSGGYGGGNIGVILSAQVQFNNFSLYRALHGEGWNPIPSGDGQKLSLGVQVSGKGYQSYSMGFQEPWLGGRPNSLGVNFSYDLINYQSRAEKDELFSGSVSLGRRLKWPDDYFQQRSILSYQLYNITGSNGPRSFSFLAEGTSSILSLKEVLERNSVDSPISPTRGSKVKLSGEIAPPFPGFSQFYKIKGMYQNHTTLVGDLVLTNTIRYGYLGYLGHGQRSNFKRFVLGGTKLQQRQSFVNDNIDLRGYPGGRGQYITPRTASGREIGGRLFSKYSLELRISAVQSKQVQLYPYTFFDAGNSYRDFNDFAPFNVKRATGVGLRLYLPILGLVDLSYGYRLDGIPGTLINNTPSDDVEAGHWQFLFNLGAPF